MYHITYFYPRSPCGERRRIFSPLMTIPNFYPRSPCGERLFPAFPGLFQHGISIHALLAESDGLWSPSGHPDPAFLSTLSLRRATSQFGIVFRVNGFLSTLSLRRATALFIGMDMEEDNFYPRSPCGERHKTVTVASGGSGISIHALLAESDRSVLCSALVWSISIHALLAESDSKSAQNSGALLRI